MQNYQVIFKSVFASVLGCTMGFATAADTQNLSVTATVSATCKFFSTAQTLTFGTVDPSSAGPISGSGASVSYKCTKGTAATGVTLSTGANPQAGVRRMGNGTDFIPYSLSLTGGTQTGAGFGSAVTASALTFTSAIVATDYQNVSAGSYTDTVVMSITP